MRERCTCGAEMEFDRDKWPMSSINDMLAEFRARHRACMGIWRAQQRRSQ